MSEEHQSLIKTPKQLITVVVLSFVIPVVLIIMLVKLVIGGQKPADNPEAILQRIKPVGEVRLGPPAAPGAAPSAPAVASAAPGATAPAATAGPPDGKKVYQTVCAVCHVAGVAGAPKFGDKAAWAPRIQNGVDSLYASVVNGKGAMPPKGGNASLADAEIKAAVDYMVAESK